MFRSRSGNTNGFVDHHFSTFHKVVIIEDAIAQFPEGCAGLINAVLNICFNGSLLE